MTDDGGGESDNSPFDLALSVSDAISSHAVLKLHFKNVPPHVLVLVLSVHRIL